MEIVSICLVRPLSLPIKALLNTDKCIHNKCKMIIWVWIKNKLRQFHQGVIGVDSSTLKAIIMKIHWKWGIKKNLKKFIKSKTTILKETPSSKSNNNIYKFNNNNKS